jgi:hypothetical protein
MTFARNNDIFNRPFTLRQTYVLNHIFFTFWMCGLSDGSLDWLVTHECVTFTVEHYNNNVFLCNSPLGFSRRLVRFCPTGIRHSRPTQIACAWITTLSSVKEARLLHDVVQVQRIYIHRSVQNQVTSVFCTILQ